MNIYEKIEEVRVSLQESDINKSGKNNFAGFNYFTLDDILPTLNRLMREIKLFSNFSIENGVATLTIVDCEKPDDKVVFSSPIAEAQIKGSTPIQSLGGVHTYMKRYLYLNAFEIAEGDVLDALSGSNKLKQKETSHKKEVRLDENLLAKATAFGISLEKVAMYNKKPIEQVTNDDLAKAIELQKTALEKKNQKENKDA